jgi:hypothetical protein
MRPKARRVAASFVLVALATAVLGTPATAAGTTSERHGVFAEAFWFKSEKVKHGYRITSWQLYVFRDTVDTAELAEALLSYNVQKCKRPLDAAAEAKRHAKGKRPVQQNKCVTKETMDGTGDSSGAHFTIDEANLGAAHLDTTIDLVSRNGKGEETGPPVPTQVFADWTGRDAITGTDGTLNFHHGTCTRSETFQDAAREADTAATVGATGLGATDLASLGTSSGTTHFEGDCGEDPIPLGPTRGAN